ncbi:MAG TPA: GrpB family protein, partial [Bacilli bacterium]|nr:GrpB family protein [Bacilli bacterium]
ETKRYDDFLILKNYLLNHPEVCKLYIEKKQELSKNSREEYRRLKSEIVNKIINMARETR